MSAGTTTEPDIYPPPPPETTATTVPSTIPVTGSDATAGLSSMALVLVGVGAIVMLVARRTKPGGLDPRAG